MTSMIRTKDLYFFVWVLVSLRVGGLDNLDIWTFGRWGIRKRACEPSAFGSGLVGMIGSSLIQGA